MTLGQRITKRRKDLRISRDELAAITGISYSQLWRYENDENEPASGAILALAKILQVSTDWLLGNVEISGVDGLTELERKALAVLRAQSPQKQETLVAVLTTISNL